MNKLRNTSYLIRDAHILSPGSKYHLKKADVFYKNGKIEEIGRSLKVTSSNIIDAKNKYLSFSWIDTFADFASPGYEYRETIRSGVQAAVNGGFGTVFLAPNNQPVTSSVSEVRNLTKETENTGIDIKILASVSKQALGKELAEMQDTKQAGAIAFTDGWAPIQNELLLFKALEYVKAVNSTIIQIPVLHSLNSGGIMNEGNQSVAFGISGMPAIAEEIMIYRDLALARYSRSKIHISGVSTKRGLDIIRQAKKEKVQVTCSVTPYHLLWTDEELSSYDSMFKVNPPLRTKEDVKALVDGLEKGWIDCIATHHKPCDWDEKNKELEYARSGVACLETAWPMLLRAVPGISMERWAELLVYNPRRIFGLEENILEKEAQGTLTLFDTDTSWQLTAATKKSKAFNVPLLNEELAGRAILIG